MKNFSLLPLLITFLTVSLAGISHAENGNLRWLVYYGDKLKESDLKDVQLAIVEAGHFTPGEHSGLSTKFFGYISVGEAEEYRSYWNQAKKSQSLVERNPLWKGSHLVDIRVKEWQDILMNQVIPKIVGQGYQGIFLDTIDTAIELEERDPKKFSGSREAMIQFIREIKKKYPSLLILPNNGLEILPRIGDVVYGVVVEDLYTRHNFAKKTNQKTPVEDTNAKERMLDGFILGFHKPVLNIIYEKSPDTKLARYAIERSRAKGYAWYLTSVDLMKLGFLAP